MPVNASSGNCSQKEKNGACEKKQTVSSPFCFWPHSARSRWFPWDSSFACELKLEQFCNKVIQIWNSHYTLARILYYSPLPSCNYSTLLWSLMGILAFQEHKTLSHLHLHWTSHSQSGQSAKWRPGWLALNFSAQFPYCKSLILYSLCLQAQS